MYLYLNLNTCLSKVVWESGSFPCSWSLLFTTPMLAKKRQRAIKLDSSCVLLLVLPCWIFNVKSCAYVYKMYMFCKWNIIMSRYYHGYFWTSLATLPYRPLLSADPHGYITYRHRAAVRRFELDILPLLVHVKGSTRVHLLWARPYFSSSALRLVRLILIVSVMGGRWPYSCCFVGCCLQDLFNIIRSILV